MLLELHVRNLALIEKADLELKKGLTVLSGETGAGKSVLIDSINLALGAKTGKGVIRKDAEYAYIELVFVIEDEKKLEKIRSLDIDVAGDGLLIITRKISPSRSVAKINDETVTAAKLRSLTGLLIDMHGQFEHQSLMYPAKHLEFVDMASGSEALCLKEEIRTAYGQYSDIEKVLSEGMDRTLREREADILRYEIEEIENADLKAGEEQELLDRFRKMNSFSKISVLLSQAAGELETDSVSRAARDLARACELDGDLSPVREQLSQLDDLMGDALRSINDYMSSMEYDEEEFSKIQDRLDIIHRLQGKYTDDVEEIKALAEKKRERLEYLENYEGRRGQLIKRKEELSERLESLCSRLGDIRRRTGEELREKIIIQLKELNFPGVRFDIEFNKLEKFTENGSDQAAFLISANPGQPLKPISEVASGGELSRIMLALKTVLADIDETDTLVFDEIDAGISGRTAQAVAGRLSLIGREHQVLCITHLPQIAAMADNHYLISKSTDGESTRTDIRQITGKDVTSELARMIGGSEITDTVLTAAGEMKKLADELKNR